MHLDLNLLLYTGYMWCRTPFEHIKGGFVLRENFRFMLLTICLLDRWEVERVICFHVMMILCAHIGPLYHGKIILNLLSEPLFRSLTRFMCGS